MTEEEKNKDIQTEADQLFASSKNGESQKQIQVMGIGKSYDWRKEIEKGFEFAVQSMKIGLVGTNLSSLIPFAQFLYLDNNLLYKWE